MGFIKNEINLSSQNLLSGYFPSRTNYNEEDFDWEVAKAILIRNLYLKTLTIKNFNSFITKCERDFLNRCDEEELWPYIQRMYLQQEVLFNISPEFQLFRLTELKKNSAKNRLGELFISLLQGFHIDKPVYVYKNFIEQQIVDTMQECLSPFKGKEGFKGNNEEPFLPFLTNIFQKDIEFLVNNPSYFIDISTEFLKLYGYLYTTQLALNIKGFPSEPESKPLYFIMEDETASQERVDLKKYGHQKVLSSLEYIFPYLSMSETIQNIDVKSGERRKPLWRVIKELTYQDRAYLIKYTKNFAADRFKNEDYIYPYDESTVSVLDCVKELLKQAVKQFAKGTGRHGAQQKFIRATEVELCSTFVKNRGRMGKISVINQDYLLILTNISIGNKNKLRFHELLTEFKARGIYFDKKSQQNLIQFYERVGNVERMSDSGDAVYVYKTI